MIVIVYAVFGVGGNQRGSSRNQIITLGASSNGDYGTGGLREFIKKDWESVLIGNTPCPNEFRYKLGVVKVSDGHTTFKHFNIDPKKLK